VFFWANFHTVTTTKISEVLGFFEKSNFSLNAKILEKFAKLWKPQN
jgi:hypothetical protein